MIDEWLDIEEADRGVRKNLFTLDEKDGGRAAVEDRLIDLVGSVRVNWLELANLVS